MAGASEKDEAEKLQSGEQRGQEVSDDVSCGQTQVEAPRLEEIEALPEFGITSSWL